MYISNYINPVKDDLFKYIPINTSLLLLFFLLLLLFLLWWNAFL